MRILLYRLQEPKQPLLSRETGPVRTRNQKAQDLQMKLLKVKGFEITHRYFPTHRRRGIRPYLGRNRAGRSDCVRTRRSRSRKRVFGAAAGGPI